MQLGFLQTLKNAGWEEIQYDWLYRKGDWTLQRDTSSWWIISSGDSRIFDLSEPSAHNMQWSVNLAEHLCKTFTLLNELQKAQSRSNRTSE